MVLRSVKTGRAGARLQAFKLGVSGGVPALGWNNADFGAPVDNGTGDTTLPYAELFRRSAITLVTPGEDVGAGAYAHLNAAAAASNSQVKSITNAGVAADGTIHGLVYGWDLDMPQSAGWAQRVHVTHMAPRLIPLRLTAPGTLTEGKFQATVSASTNTSTITFNYPFAVPPTVVAVPDAAGNSVVVSSVSVNQVVLKQYDSSGAAATGGMHVLVLGQDLPNKIFKLRRALKCVQLKPRIVAGIVTSSGGAWSTAGYADLGSPVDNGAGDVSLTFEKPFLRAPVVLASSAVAGSVAVTSVSVTGCRLVAATNAGVATDSSIHVLALGFDYADQL